MSQSNQLGIYRGDSRHIELELNGVKIKKEIKGLCIPNDYFTGLLSIKNFLKEEYFKRKIITDEPIDWTEEMKSLLALGVKKVIELDTAESVRVKKFKETMRERKYDERELKIEQCGVIQCTDNLDGTKSIIVGKITMFIYNNKNYGYKEIIDISFQGINVLDNTETTLCVSSATLPLTNLFLRERPKQTSRQILLDFLLMNPVYFSASHKLCYFELGEDRAV